MARTIWAKWKLVGDRTVVARSSLRRFRGEAKEVLSGGFLQRHRLTATSSVRSALKVLQKTDLVYRTENGWVVYDRIFGEWLRRLA